MPRFVLADDLVNLLDDWLGVPLGRAAIPVIQAHLAAKVQHQGF